MVLNHALVKQMTGARSRPPNRGTLNLLPVIQLMQNGLLSMGKPTISGLGDRVGIKRNNYDAWQQLGCVSVRSCRLLRDVSRYAAGQISKAGVRW
jgi:hypothetical protein